MCPTTTQNNLTNEFKKLNTAAASPWPQTESNEEIVQTCKSEISAFWKQEAHTHVSTTTKETAVQALSVWIVFALFSTTSCFSVDLVKKS